MTLQRLHINLSHNTRRFMSSDQVDSVVATMGGFYPELVQNCGRIFSVIE